MLLLPKDIVQVVDKSFSTETSSMNPYLKDVCDILGSCVRTFVRTAHRNSRSRKRKASGSALASGPLATPLATPSATALVAVLALSSGPIQEGVFLMSEANLDNVPSSTHPQCSDLPSSPPIPSAVPGVKDGRLFCHTHVAAVLAHAMAWSSSTCGAKDSASSGVLFWKAHGAATINLFITQPWLVCAHLLQVLCAQVHPAFSNSMVRSRYVHHFWEVCIGMADPIHRALPTCTCMMSKCACKRDRVARRLLEYAYQLSGANLAAMENARLCGPMLLAFLPTVRNAEEYARGVRFNQVHNAERLCNFARCYPEIPAALVDTALEQVRVCHQAPNAMYAQEQSFVPLGGRAVL
jgi:hypothetical protein